MSSAADADIEDRGWSGIALRDVHLWCLPAAILVYALWGTPTPDKAGFAEIAIGLLLVVAVGLPRAAAALKIGRGALWERAGKVLLLYGLTVPVIGGLVHGNAVGAMARDIAPFLFMILPVFLVPLWQGRSRALYLLSAAVAVLGLVFALRVLMPAFFHSIEFKLAGMPDPFLLANSPAVLFAALLFFGLGGTRLYQEKVFSGVVLLALSVIPLLTMALIGQRASVGMFCFSGFMLAGIGAWRRPLRMGLPLVVAAVLLAFIWPYVQEIAGGLAHKNSLVGFNMRWQEAAAVMQALGGSALHVIFGKGWGANMASPAVGGAVVNFTHSLLTTYWLKTGLVGMAMAVFYLFWLGLLFLPLLQRYPVMALALGGPFAIDILLYASFKSLDFGLILLLIPLWAYLPKKLA